MKLQDLLRGRAPREDLQAPFPPLLVDPTGPALLTEMPAISAALVAAHLLRVTAMRGGTRIQPSSLETLIRQLERSVTDDVRAHAREEALRTADWIDNAPAPDEVDVAPPRDELEHMRRSDTDSRLQVARWAYDHELDLEMEWYDADADAWPRGRVHVVDVDADAERPALVIEHRGREERVDIVDIRLLMPVERIDRPTATGARVLMFPGFSEEE